MTRWYWTNDVDSSDEDHGWCVVEEYTERVVALELLQKDAIDIVRLHNDEIVAADVAVLDRSAVGSAVPDATTDSPDSR